MGAEVAALAIAAIGAGASYYNTTQTANNQDQALAQQVQDQQRRQREADALVQAQLQRTGASNPNEERATAMQEYLTQIQRAQGNAEGGLAGAGAVSDRFTSDAGAAGKAISDYATGTADIYSRIDAPLRQREREGIEFSRLGSDIGTVGMLAGSDDYLSRLRLQRASQRNPWIDAFAQAAQSYGSAAGGGGGLAGAGGAGMTGGWSGQPLPGATTPLRGWGP